MNNQTINFIKNVGSMFFANGISFVISSFITFFLPKILNIENYAYIQLYIFYVSYISYMHYGWVDGIRLRYGGAYYEKLDKPLFNSQILSYSIIQIIISFSVIFVVLISNIEGNRKIAALAVGICMLMRLPRLMPQYILEMSNHIKECSQITLIERVLYLISTIIVIICNKASVFSLLCCDLFGQLVAGIYAFWCCKDLLLTKPVSIQIATQEAKLNIVSGIKLTIANVASLLIIGIIRQCIEYQWDVETFGKISLTISLSNLLMVFIRAVSMVMFPTLRRVNKENLKPMYSAMRIGIMIPLFAMLITYYPIKVIMGTWLPQYEESLKYMALLFPMCIFESKMSMLIETYLKTIRMENWLLKINLITVGLSAFFAFLTTYVWHNLTLAVVSIVILLVFRCVIAENVLAKKMKLNVKKHILCELILVSIFMLSNWFIGGITGELIYLVCYFCYLIVIRNDIKDIILIIKGRVFV